MEGPIRRCCTKAIGARDGTRTREDATSHVGPFCPRGERPSDKTAENGTLNTAAGLTYLPTVCSCATERVSSRSKGGPHYCKENSLLGPKIRRTPQLEQNVTMFQCE
jgi:hypothetical protein